MAITMRSARGGAQTLTPLPRGFTLRARANSLRWRLFAPALIALASGCGSDLGPSPPSSHSDAIFGGDTGNVTYWSQLPMRAVGYLQKSNGNCSATAIERNVVLTAAHCIYDNGGITQAQAQAGQIVFHLPYMLSGVQTDVNGGAGIPSVGYATLATSAIQAGNKKADESERYADLAVIFLSQPLTMTELPIVPYVQTASNWFDRVLAGELAGPARITGWAGSNTVKKSATLQQGLQSESDCGFLGLGSCGPTWLDSSACSDEAQVQGGDSGGPLVLYDRDDANVTIVGVASGLQSQFAGVGCDESVWSPTFNNGDSVPNGDWLAQYLQDGDHDGIWDGQDNCPPSVCNNDPSKNCFNPDQTDTDLDGLGDRCDNCPTVVNLNQVDSDHDRVGDACDSCPDSASSLGEFDPDSDFVGSSCDNCPSTYNPPMACHTDADCTSKHQGGKCLGADVADVDSRTWGRCDGGTRDGTICRSMADCGGVSCVGVNGWRRCVAQVNSDGDAKGDACDNCPDLSNDFLRANSNREAEQQQSVKLALGDICDGAPTFVARPEYQQTTDPSSAAPFTTFRASAGIGDATYATAAKGFPARVGFRWCDCSLGGIPTDSKQSCILAGLCSLDPAQFGKSQGDPTSKWSHLTTGAWGQAVHAVGQPPTAVYDQILSRKFAVNVACDDTEPHPWDVGPPEPCRLGPQEQTYWFHDVDATSTPPRVNKYDGVSTIGLFWSHVVFDSAYADARDSTTSALLRESYAFVRTPETPPFLFTNLGLVASTGCPIGGCNPVLRTDWLSDPPPDLVESALTMVSTPARLVSAADGSVVAVRRNVDARINVTTVLSSEVTALITDRTQRFLTPVETGARASGGAPGLQFVSLPSTWNGNASTISRIDIRGGVLQVSGRVRGEILALGRSAVVPDARAQAKGVLSARDGAVYLIGGRRGTASGMPTGEVWRYRLDSQEWERSFTETSGDAPVVSANTLARPSSTAQTLLRQVHPGDVLAAAYHSYSGRLVVLDRVQSASKPGLVVARLALFDTHTQRSGVLLQWPYHGHFSAYGMAALDDGSFVLVLGDRDRDHWTALQFDVSAQGTVGWKGIQQGRGTLLDDPFVATSGTYVPVGGPRGDELVELVFRSFCRTDAEPGEM